MRWADAKRFLLSFQELPMGLKQPAEAARRPENRTKNRYGNIIACEWTKSAAFKILM